ncbi:MAG: universal stress protein [Mycetocola sp.]
MSEETVVGWDGSAPAQRALEWALTRAESRAEGVLIARVVAEKDASTGHTVREAAIDAAESALEEAHRSAQLRHPRLRVESRLLFGDPVEELRSLSDEDTLIVVGTHPSPNAAANVPWSIGARLAATSHGPVALIPDSELSLDSGRSGIVAGVDGSAASLVAAQYAAAEAVRRGEMLTAVHAWQIPPVWAESELDADSMDALEEVHRGILTTATDHVQREFPTLTISKAVVNQPAMAALHDAVKQSRMLVLGNHGLKAAPRLALGPVSHSMVRQVDVPTIVVRDSDNAP